jgi:hypothetical protein
MKIINTTNKSVQKLILKYPYVVIHYCLSECPELVENYIRFSTDEKYKEITFIRVDPENATPVKKIVQEFGKPLVAIYKNGLLIESKSVRTGAEMKKMLDKLVKKN